MLFQPSVSLNSSSSNPLSPSWQKPSWTSSPRCSTTKLEVEESRLISSTRSTLSMPLSLRHTSTTRISSAAITSPTSIATSASISWTTLKIFTCLMATPKDWRRFSSLDCRARLKTALLWEKSSTRINMEDCRKSFPSALLEPWSRRPYLRGFLMWL